MSAPDPQQPEPSSSASPTATSNRPSRAPGRATDWLLGIVVAAVLAAVAIPGVRTRPEHAIEVASVERLEELVRLACDQAVATGDDHFVLLEASQQEAGEASVLVFRDLDGDAAPSEIEVLGRVSLAPATWGSAAAHEPAIGDTGTGLEGPWSFAARSRPAAIDPGVPTGEPVARPTGSRGVVFDATGVPHGLSQAGLRGAAGSGAGSLYLRTTTQDYALVLSPWGDVDVQVWDAASASWQVAVAP